MTALRWEGRKKWPFLLALAGIMTFVVALRAVPRSYVSSKPLELDQTKRMTECRDRLQRLINPKVVDLQTLGGIHGLCYAEVNEEDTLAEFGIRRSAFLNQQLQTPVMLWLVVSITVSGVLLAAIQLLAGYRLALAGKAAFDQGGKLDFDKSKISLSSSVTGLLILVISLAFFYIFVTQVYLIKEVGIAPIKSEAGNPNLEYGWGGAGNLVPNPLTTLRIPGSTGERTEKLSMIGGGLGLAPERLTPVGKPSGPKSDFKKVESQSH
jgi:hypothetical protein